MTKVFQFQKLRIPLNLKLITVIETSIVHFHVYKGLDRDPAQRMDNYLEIKEKYAKYLKEYGLYDKC